MIETKNYSAKLPTVALISLGCPKNLVDSEIILGIFSDNLYSITTRWEEADIVVVNTCAFLASARKEAMEVIKNTIRWKKRSLGKLIIAGCLVQYYGDKAPEIFPDADILLGVGEYGKLPGILEELHSSVQERTRFLANTHPRFPFHSDFPRRVSTPGHYAYLRISDGCNNRCTYCLIPELRGCYQERPSDRVISEARQLVDDGVREIILIAQDTTFYGRDQGENGDFSTLIKALNNIRGLDWIRIMYTHPGHIDMRLLQTIAECDKVCPYLDIPLQHINDSILAGMGRKIKRREIENILRKARELIEGVSIRTTLMVGFPGEGEKEFSELVDFVKDQKFEHLGVFSYSAEDRTRAYRSRVEIDPVTSARRRNELMEIQQKVSAERLKKLRGETFDILIDGPYPEAEPSLMVGRAPFQAPEVDGLVVVEGENLKPGRVVKVKITDSSEYDLYGVKLIHKH